MISFSYTIDKKVTIKTVNGDDILDLAAPSLKKGVTFNVLNYVIVRNTEVMRPDSIAQRYYGEMTHTEMLMKFNGISNPFSVDEGDLLMIADPVSGRFGMNDNSVINRGDVRKQYYQPEKEGKPDPRLKTFESRVKIKPASAKKAGQALPPNYATPGDKEFEIVGGKIVFGANVSKGGSGVGDVPLEKQRFLENLKKTAAYKKVTKMSNAISQDSSTMNPNPQGPNLSSEPAKTGPAVGNGVPNSALSADEKKKIDEQKAKRDAAKKLLENKVNLSKSDLISKLVKDLYGKV